MPSPHLLLDMLHHAGHSPAQRTDNVSEGYSPEATGGNGVDRRWGVPFFTKRNYEKTFTLCPLLLPMGYA